MTDLFDPLHHPLSGQENAAAAPAAGSPTAGLNVPLPPVMQILDQLGIALALYDEEERALAWNQTFLRMFPEHRGHITRGEPYAENLRRFYRSRLAGEEVSNINRYVAGGLERHRRQSAPFSFVHRGQWLRVASLPIAGIGRMRIWTPIQSPQDGRTIPQEMKLTGSDQVLSTLAQIGDGAVARDRDGKILGINRRFAELYELEEPDRVIGLTFPDVLTLAWHSHERAREALHAWQDSSRFPEAPFELPLPGDRWVRVREHHVSEGHTIATHVDVTDLIRLQRSALEAQYRAEGLAATLRAEIKERSAFIDLLAHEVQQPLSDASSCLETLTDAMRIGTSPDQENLAGTQRIAQILDRIVLTLSNTLTAATTLNMMSAAPRHPQSLGLLIEMVRLSLPDAYRDRLSVLLDTLRSTFVLDPVLVSLALNNLVRNALLHGEINGPVVLSVSDDDLGGLRFVVRNRGRPDGLVSDCVIFERYPRSGKRLGASLGLWIVGQVAALHNGSAEGRIGPETVFVLRLPAASTPQSPTVR